MAAAGAPSEESSWMQEMFGSFLSLHDVPSAHQTSEVLKATQDAAASMHNAHGLNRDSFVPLIHMMLPDASLSAVSLLASLV